MHGENGDTPETINNLMELVQFVVALAELAEHKYETEGTGAWTLAFKTKDGLGLLETRFGEELLDIRDSGRRLGNTGRSTRPVRWHPPKGKTMDVHGHDV